jgi:hypothetical protein
MKYTLLITLTFIIYGVFGQSVESLEKVSKVAKLKNEQAIIYGNFIQRLGFSSGGFPQDIYVKNIETNEFYKFRVKPTYKSRKDNTFCFYIPAGTYIIYSYFWTQSKWYGGTWHGEPILKGIDVTQYNEDEEIVPEHLMDSDSLRFKFTVKQNSINYSGTWHFNSGLVSFSNDKEEFDMEIKTIYKKLDFENATILLPE